MIYPTSLKDLLELCQTNGLKFKGKRIAQLIELLEANSVSADGVFEEDIATLPVKRLREKCKEIGLSVYGTKAELIRRLKSSSNEAVSIPVVQWRERGRRIPTRPSETVDEEDSAEDDTVDGSKYKDMKKNDLRQECLSRKLPVSGNMKALVKRLEENDVLNDDIDKNAGTPEKLCGRCEENPNKLHKTTAAKWFCHECGSELLTYV